MCPMRVLIVVPARGGSVRLPGKNLRPLGGRSLLAWTAAAIADAGLDGEVVLSTDCEAIADEGRRLGWSVPFLRPAELARSETPTFPVVVHALDRMSALRGGDPDAVLLLQPTSPFRAGALLRDAVDMLDARPDADAVLAVTKVKVGGRWLLECGAEGMLHRVAENAPADIYIPTGAAYLVRTAALRREETLVPARTLPLPHHGLSVLDIDTFDDFHLAEAALHWERMGKENGGDHG